MSLVFNLSSRSAFGSQRDESPLVSWLYCNLNREGILFDVGWSLKLDAGTCLKTRKIWLNLTGTRFIDPLAFGNSLK